MQDNILVAQLIENLLGKHIDSAFPAAHYTKREIDDFKGQRDRYIDSIA